MERAGMTLPAWMERYRLVIAAMVGSFILHGALLFSGSYRNTYDAYVHIFFADHYRRNWWSLWETRWYTGFTMVSYPPLTHQLTALLAKFTSLPTGFILVMLTSSVVTTLGVYRFSHLWVEHRPACYAALLAVVSSSIAETIHVFGQLPTMFVIGVLLNTLPFLWVWLDRGRLRDLARAWALLMVAAAGHHVTTLFGMVFFSGPIFVTVILNHFRRPRADEEPFNGFKIRPSILIRYIIRRLRRITPVIIRSGIFGVGMILLLVITVLPYWLWSRSDPITQITIPHGSRENFIQNPNIGFMFFVVPWGVMLAILPYAFYKGFASKNWILASSLALLTLLGTGGTTPIPALLLRGAFYILTLDRFTFWATIVVLPFAGQFVESLLHGRLGKWIIARLGVWWRVIFAGILGLGMVSFALFTANLAQFRRFQPPPINMSPIVEFMAKDNHDHWRYMTLGFGDQMAWLSAQTTALNVEGNYHSARRLPELTSTPVERLDGAKYTAIPGLGSLHQFLTNPQKYNLKYIFVNDAFYEPLLFFSGWYKVGTLDNGIRVWERADVPPLPAAIPVKTYPAWQRLMWGGLPIGSLVISAFVFAWTAFVTPHIPFRPQKWLLLRQIWRWRLVQGWLVDNPSPTQHPPSGNWQIWNRYLAKWLPGIRLEPLARRSMYAVTLFLLLIGGVFWSSLLLHHQTEQPEQVILAYYDALDFKRFSESYQYLKTDLDQAEYLRWLSLQGGIVASFSKLENLDVQTHQIGKDHLSARVKADWLTALGDYEQVTQYELVKVNGKWRILLDVVPPPPPRITFVNRPIDKWFLDLPLGTLDEGALTRGVLDRSLLSVGEISVVYSPAAPIGFQPEGPDAARIGGRFEGLISVLGSVTNRDPYPSQITVTAILYGRQGEQLAETNVATIMFHQLLPSETTLFRADFSGYDATMIQDIRQIAALELVVQGVPTPYNLDRSLVVLEDGRLYNSGAALVDIPHILVAERDSHNQLVWVDEIYVNSSIEPDGIASYTKPRMPTYLFPVPMLIQITGPRLVEWQSLPFPVEILVHGYSQ